MNILIVPQRQLIMLSIPLKNILSPLTAILTISTKNIHIPAQMLLRLKSGFPHFAKPKRIMILLPYLIKLVKQSVLIRVMSLQAKP